MIKPVRSFLAVPALLAATTLAIHSPARTEEPRMKTAPATDTVEIRKTDTSASKTAPPPKVVSDFFDAVFDGKPGAVKAYLDIADKKKWNLTNTQCPKELNTNFTDWPPLTIAAFFSNYPIIKGETTDQYYRAGKILILANTNVDAKTPGLGDTAAIVCARQVGPYPLKLLEELIAVNANLIIINQDGETALSTARAKQNTEAVKIIKNKLIETYNIQVPKDLGEEEALDYIDILTREIVKKEEIATRANLNSELSWARARKNTAAIRIIKDKIIETYQIQMPKDLSEEEALDYLDVMTRELPQETP